MVWITINNHEIHLQDNSLKMLKVKYFGSENFQPNKKKYALNSNLILLMIITSRIKKGIMKKIQH